MEEKDDRYSHILKYTGIFGGVQGLGILVGLVRTKLVAWLLGPEGYGLVSLFNSTIKTVSDSTNLGLSMSAVHEISDAYEKEDGARLEHTVKVIRSWSLLTALLGMMVCLVLSPLLNRWTFNWGDHTLHFVLLSPVVALMAITGGEMAVLKATRQLRHLAAISIYAMLGSLIITVPLYYFWREAAIVPSLFAVALLQMLLAIGYSYRLYPLRLSLRRSLLSEGLGMVWLGIAFAVAGIMGSGAELIIRAYLNNADSLDAVGLYSFGYMMTMTYAGMVFSAMDTEYFPRLSAIPNLGQRFNDAVNSQIEVCLLLITPMLVAFMTGLPILLPLLSSGKFIPILGMMQVMVLAIFMRAIEFPLSYIPLARGASWSYMLMEGCYDIAIVVLVIFGFSHWGLLGTGIAVAVAAVFDFLILYFYMHWRFQYRLSSNVVQYVAILLPIVLLSYASTHITTPWLYWTTGFILFIISATISIRILQKKTHIVENLLKRIRNKWRK
ncbi:MAG: oligosaccharide flippase family protein [Prevotella sp.]|nr:oligosaccharide flippase family protein [Prevotella sp.]